MRINHTDNTKHMEDLHRENNQMRDELQQEKLAHNKEKEDRIHYINDKDRAYEVLQRELHAMKDSHLEAERSYEDKIKDLGRKLLSSDERNNFLDKQYETSRNERENIRTDTDVIGLQHDIEELNATKKGLEDKLNTY